MQIMTRQEIQAEIDDLSRIEVHVRTNQGTYGATEAGRKVGTGDPRLANREEYETAGGATRVTGPDVEDAPGRMRDIGSARLSKMRAELAELRAELRTAK